MPGFDITMAQINTLVGDFDGNLAQVLEVVRHAEAASPEAVVVFPELTLCGYPPEDLLLRPSMDRRVDAALQWLAAEVGHSYVVIGYPRRVKDRMHNMAGVLHRGKLVAEYSKQCLPNYQVFDEKRYFVPGGMPCVVDMHGVPVAITICEDIWEPAPAAQARAAGAELILNINSSPFHRGKQQERMELVSERARDAGIPIVYVNQVGGQDELVFDGGSFAVNADGQVCTSLPNYLEATGSLRADWREGRCVLGQGPVAPPLEPLESIYQALVLGVRDYVNKNRFGGVVLGLSGGIE